MVSQLSFAQARNPTGLVQSRNHQLASFPHLEHPEFEKSCSTLLNRFELYTRSHAQWTAVENVSQNGTTFLRITKPLALHPAVADASESVDEAELDEDDNEVAVTATSSQVVVHYDIVWSPSYRVPVLYFSLADSQHRYPPTMDTLYSHIVPPAFKTQVASVGVIGGVTVTDHPATNNPVFFIHPCRTAEVMKCSASEQDITAYDYLLIWIGALGARVGLDVPLGLVDLE